MRSSDFVQDASGHLPGVVYSFNIADLKRRNAHLGHAAGDADIAELDRLLRALPGCRVARTHAERWFVLAPPEAHPQITSVIAAFARTEPFVAGYDVRGSKDVRAASRRVVIDAELRRAVRCLYAPVSSPGELEHAISRISAEDFALPVNRTIALAEIPAIAREPWQCVSRYPADPPACPLCGEHGLDYAHGDGGVYTGDGTCKACHAAIAIRDLSALAASKEPIAHYRIWIAREHGQRRLCSLLRSAIAPDHPALAACDPWDLPLVEIRADEEGRGSSVLVEALPRGESSTKFACGTGVPPFVHEIATRFAAAHCADQVVGELHPKLVFVDETGALVACAQRPLRAEGALGRRSFGAATESGMAPMFFELLLTPNEIRGGHVAGAPDDVFHLAILVWWWRRGASPFSAEITEYITAITTGTPRHAPTDALDRMLVRAFAPDPSARPTAAELCSALQSFAGSFAQPPRPAPIEPERCLAALVACIRARPRRAQPWRGRVNLATVAPALLPLFEAWTAHEVGVIDVGALAFSDRAAARELPTMSKGELYGEVELDGGTPRLDILVIAAVDRGTFLALRRPHGVADQAVEIDVARGVEIWRGTLGDALVDAVRAAREQSQTTDLDPFLCGS